MYDLRIFNVLQKVFLWSASSLIAVFCSEKVIKGWSLDYKCGINIDARAGVGSGLCLST